MSQIRGEKRVEFGENTSIARYEKEGKTFEILVDVRKAWEYKTGKNVDPTDIIQTFVIYENARRGEKATEEDIERVFGTTDVFEVAKVILKKGELQLTQEQRREFLEQKKKKIIAILARTCVNPQTGLPHPPTRIENAMEEAKVQIDIWRSAEEQVKDVLKQIQKVIPIKMETIRVAVKFPPEHAGKGYSVLERLGNIVKGEWQADGSWIALIEIPGGLKGQLINAVNMATKGKAEIKFL
ncbi:MAG: ribosome assembly factor SBDS [Candidatus Jordarchaeales archaeon]|nr:ribosome assembly factor SBDS [Candidatus Jordarchaeia archaeon]